MTYTISIGNWGSECVAGEIPDNIWKFIEVECDSDASTYLEKLEEGEVPEDLKLAEDNSSFYDVPGFFDCYGPYSDGTLTVTDEDDNEIEIDASEFPKETEYTSCTVGKPYFVWESVEKGGWDATLDIDEPFDKSKLKLHTRKLSYDDDNYSKEFITAVEYDGQMLDVELNSTRGISYELDFYEAEIQEEDED